jgi:hypothetical protein
MAAIGAGSGILIAGSTVVPGKFLKVLIVGVAFAIPPYFARRIKRSEERAK